MHPFPLAHTLFQKPCAIEGLPGDAVCLPPSCFAAPELEATVASIHSSRLPSQVYLKRNGLSATSADCSPFGELPGALYRTAAAHRSVAVVKWSDAVNLQKIYSKYWMRSEREATSRSPHRDFSSVCINGSVIPFCFCVIIHSCEHIDIVIC